MQHADYTNWSEDVQVQSHSFDILRFFSAVVISYVCTTNVNDLTWRCGAKISTIILPEDGIPAASEYGYITSLSMI